jgi:hypothetical protein
MDKRSLDSATRSLYMADELTGRRVDENALGRGCIRVEAPERALETATGRCGTRTIHPPPGPPGGAMGR